MWRECEELKTPTPQIRDDDKDGISKPLRKKQIISQVMFRQWATIGGCLFHMDKRWKRVA